MSFPSSTDSFAGFTPGDTLLADNHAAQENQQEAAIVAIENKVGTGASTPTSNTVLRGNGTGTTTYDQVHLSSDVSGVLSATNGGTGTNSTSSLLTTFLATIYPVGCIYAETTGVNPGTTFGFGSWSAYGAGRVLIGNGTSDQAFTAGATGGESNHTLVSNEMPSHTHTVTDSGHVHALTARNYLGGGSGTAANITTGGGTFVSSSTDNTTSATTGVTNQNTGGGAAHNNLQPYQVVYYWERTA